MTTKKMESKTIALDYFNMGCSVIPIKNGTKIARVKWEKYQDQKATEKEIQKWYKDHPNDGVAVVTGAISGITVIDIDGDKGFESISQRQMFLDPKTRWHRTTRGQHYFYKYDPEVKTTAEVLNMPGVDTRSDKGYIIVHNPGSTYKVMNPVVFSELKTIPPTFKDAPPEKINLNNAKPKYVNEVESFWRYGVEEGKRNQAIHKMAKSERYYGVPLPKAISKLLGFNARSCKPPLPEQEIVGAVNSAYKDWNEDVESIEQSKPISLKELINKPSRDPSQMYLVNDLLTRGTPSTSLVVAPPKVGKSQFAISLAYAVAKGIPFLKKQTFKKEKVLYLALERSVETWIERFRKMFAKEKDLLEQIDFQQLRRTPNAMNDVATYAKEKGIGLIIIDMLAQLQNIQDENKYKAVGDSIHKLLITPSRISGAHVMALHHAGKEKGRETVDTPLGSTAYGGMVDVIISLRKKSNEIRTFTATGNDIEPITRPRTLLEDPKTGFITDGGTYIPESTVAEIEDALAKNPHSTLSEIKQNVTGKNEDIQNAVQDMVDDGEIEKIKRVDGVKGYKYRLP